MATRSLIIAALLTLTTAQHSSLFEQYLDGNINFTANVYQQLQEGEGNFVLSPISVQLVLALTHYGAGGNTARQLATALNLPHDREDLVRTIEDLTPLLRGNDKYALHSVNKIYAKKDFQFSDEFSAIARCCFKAETESINFNDKVEAARKMNNWAAQKTNGKISALIDPILLNNRTTLVLLNAIFFKGKWFYDFDDHFTQDRDFHINKDDTIRVNMMQMTTRLKYYKSEKLHAQFVELPYIGENISMTIVLPDYVEGLRNIEQNILQVLQPKPYKEEDVHVRLPKFTISSTIDFTNVMINLGVHDVFDDRKANLTGMSKNRQSLKIDQIIQKAVLELDEKGTTATAATFELAAIPISALYVPPPPPILFEVNRPFMYYLKSPAGILFIGRYVENTE